MGEYFVGQKIKFEEEKQRYTVKAISDNFVICSKPFNPRKTVLYCIIDIKKNIRGPENLIFPMGCETEEEIEEMLQRLIEGESEVSHRGFLPLNIVEKSSLESIN